MVKLVINANSYKEALMKLDNLGYQVKVNKTNMWKKAGSPRDLEFDAFAVEQLEKDNITEKNTGCIIVASKGVADTRKKPYSIDVLIRNGEHRKYHTVYEVVDANNTIVGVVDTTKADAVCLLKEFITKNHINARILIRKYPLDEGVEAVGFYTPSKNTAIGEYIFFGN